MKIRIYVLYIQIIIIILTSSLGAVTIQVGKGSYTDILPSGNIGPQNIIYKTSRIIQPVPTNDWWSSIAWFRFDKVTNGNWYAYIANYAFPLAFRTKPGGLGVSYPDIHVKADVVEGFYKEDFIIYGAGLVPDSAKIDGFSDWSVDVLYKDKYTDKNVIFTLTKGSPFVYLKFCNCNPEIKFSRTFIVFDSKGKVESSIYTNDNLGVIVNNHYYGFFAPKGTIWRIDEDKKTISNNSKDYLSIALMSQRNDLNYFYKYAYAFIKNTSISWRYDVKLSEVITEFSVSIETKQYNQNTTLLLLFPHQYKNSTEEFTKLEYTTLRGKLKLIANNRFTVKNKFHGVLPFLPEPLDQEYNRKHLQQLVNNAEKLKIDSYPDTYFHGKELAKIAKLIPIAEQIGDLKAKQRFIKILREDLSNWFTYSEGEKGRFFYYDNNWGGLIGYPVSFCAERFTDHHFHYGYFVYASAILALYDSEFIKDYGGMVEMLIQEYACSYRDDEKFPFLRTMSPYAGHSYAGGYGWNLDGNSQEAGGEAINSWVAIYLWGLATENNVFRDLGIWGYTTEISAINEYWFDVDNKIYPNEYKHCFVNIPYGGKATYYSYDKKRWNVTPEYLHMIQFIPITSGSLYLGYNQEYTRRFYSEIVAENEGDEDEWHDLIWMYQVLFDPKSVIKKYDENKSLDNGNTWAFTYHWIHNMHGLEVVDTETYADAPGYSVFKKSDVRTYIAYNFSFDKDKKISFYRNGYLGYLIVPPCKLVISETLIK